MKKPPAIRLVLGLLLAAAGWYVLSDWTYVSGEVEWTCYGSECGTDDWRPILAFLGIALSIGACVLLASVLRVAGVGLVLTLAPLAAVSGWQAAFEDGEVDVLSGQVGFWRVIAVVGVAVAVLGLVIEFRVPGPSWRLFGWESAPAELDEVRDRSAVLSFTDREGRRHAVRVRAHELLSGRPVRAYYLVRDPSRARVVPGRHTAVATPATTTTTKPGGDGVSLSTELTRLATLHAEGHLTDAEFEQAKRRVLGG